MTSPTPAPASPATDDYPLVPEAGERETSTWAALRNPARLRTEVLAGLVVALALIPEAISFSIIAGVDPRLGLFASFTMAVSIAILGGRPAMISAATGAVALVIAPVAREYGVDYFIATVLLAGVLQVVLAALGVAAMRVGSQRPPHARNHLYAALELMKPADDGPLTRSQVETIEGQQV